MNSSNNNNYYSNTNKENNKLYYSKTLVIIIIVIIKAEKFHSCTSHINYTYSTVQYMCSTCTCILKPSGSQDVEYY